MFEPVHAGASYTSNVGSNWAGGRRHTDHIPRRVLDLSTMFELFLRLKPKIEHEDTYNTLSRTFPGTRISLWCNGHADIVEIETDGFTSFDGVQKELETPRKNFHGKIASK